MIKWLWRRKLRRTSSDADWDREGGLAREAARVRRERLTGRQREVDELEMVLFRHDPMGINFETNTDEYRAEAETITLRRSEAQSVVAVRRIVHDEFTHWFGAETAGPEPAYEALARDIWAIWSESPDVIEQRRE